MNTNRNAAQVKSSAARTQGARRNLYAAIAADAPAWRIEAAEQALRISSKNLLAACGWNARAAQAAEVAYCNSLVSA